jgi:hypothetical protein
LEPRCRLYDDSGRPIGTAQELVLKRRCRYGGADDRPGLHVNVASACLEWAFRDRPNSEQWNRALPADRYAGAPAKAEEREDAWMTRRGALLMAGCPDWKGGGAAGEIVTLGVQPPALALSVPASPGLHRASLKVEVPNANTLWSRRFALPDKPTWLRVYVEPPGIPRKTMLAVEVEVSAGATPLVYDKGFVQFSTVSGVQATVPISIRVGAPVPPVAPPPVTPPPPVDGGTPIQPPPCTLRVILSEASTGRVLWERSGTAPCGEKP